MPIDPTDPWREPAADEPTVPFHGQAAVPPSRKRAAADLPVTAIPYQKPPRSAAVPILSVLVIILLLIVVALVGHDVSSAGDAQKRQDQLASQLAAEQRKVQELQAQVAAAKADAQKAKGDDSQGTVEQLNSCSDALDGVLKARSGSDFSKAFEAMKSQCKIAGISLF
jgi:type II secretory pathway component PulL